jgi:hypothetical protein
MNFSKLKLVTEMLAAGAGTSLTTNANNKASQQAQASKQGSLTSNNIGAQSNQMAAKPTKSNLASPVQQKTASVAKPTASMATPTTTVEQWSFWRQRSEIHKMMKEQSSDWKKDLCEALGVKDEIFHPYVDIMPTGNSKLEDAKKKAAKEAAKEKMGMTEELVDEMVYSQPHGEDRKKAEKAEKDKKAQAAKDAVRHARVTKGIPFKDAKGSGYLKNGNKVYEKRN